jgi:hypothetical protein
LRFDSGFTSTRVQAATALGAAAGRLQVEAEEQVRPASVAENPRL